MYLLIISSMLIVDEVFTFGRILYDFDTLMTLCNVCSYSRPGLKINLGHLFIRFYCFPGMQTASKDSWSDII